MQGTNFHGSSRLLLRRSRLLRLWRRRRRLRGRGGRKHRRLEGSGVLSAFLGSSSWLLIGGLEVLILLFRNAGLGGSQILSFRGLISFLNGILWESCLKSRLLLSNTALCTFSAPSSI
jgi:hypothetical protein